MSVLAARAYGLCVLDGVHLDLSDPEDRPATPHPDTSLTPERPPHLEEFARECAQGVCFGMDGKTIIHPCQIDAANDAFRPSAEEVEHGRRVIEAHAEATARGDGVALLDGKLVENLHVANARRLIALHDEIAIREVLKY